MKFTKVNSLAKDYLYLIKPNLVQISLKAMSIEVLERIMYSVFSILNFIFLIIVLFIMK